MEFDENNEFILTSPAQEGTGCENNHISSVEVYSSDDGDGNKPLGFKITANSKGEVSASPQTEKAPAWGRLRGEPAVKINLDEECGEQKWCIYIYHHKGRVTFKRVLA